ncbi:MAG: ATP-NAD kinase [Promethearchaeota archaeon]|nr:MAG: ATP-NAD kinase [Candidatus Lokiarchaeota archaeon]
MKKIGLIINPIAGMGGSVGLKGTDGKIIKKAIQLGAKPVTPDRIRTFLTNIEYDDEASFVFIVAPGKMGEDYVKNTTFKYEILGNIEDQTTAEDTKRLAMKMVKADIDLLVFCGGDGTARDIFDAIDMKIPVIAIPSGVKMFSSVFTINPIAASNILESFLEGTELVEQEVLDIDEQAFREDKLDSKLYGYLKVPKVKHLLQGGKKSSGSKQSILENKNNIAKYVIEHMEEDVLYLLGPGTTVKTISDRLNISKSLLGIDSIRNKALVKKDLNEEGILGLINEYHDIKIVVSPIGGQGFIFGRGNKQFTPKVLKKIACEDISIISTEEKLSNLDQLRVDTGDIKTDDKLKGYKEVIVGYDKRELIEVK